MVYYSSTAKTVDRILKKIKKLLTGKKICVKISELLLRDNK